MSEYAVTANGHANRLSRTDKHAPKSMYDLLESYDFSGKTILPFCTSVSMHGACVRSIERCEVNEAKNYCQARHRYCLDRHPVVADGVSGDGAACA
ncbi:MAG: hypothetical protein II118_04310 [Ruminococcus sp.]|nr:hypothetical protein [Ruminococcus sp.]MBQ1308208.1 hypothetical protein [Ruminococcus sp.]MBQ1380726.1 hypothetical protein [Ruminococcus sp.]MBQ1600687.1 hypothetical protein [Ruminococcus sp.]MBQ1807463.1 hypothetical protein [Ruminococcus sp.]